MACEKKESWSNKSRGKVDFSDKGLRRSDAAISGMSIDVTCSQAELKILNEIFRNMRQVSAKFWHSQ